MNELGRARRRPGWEILALNEAYAKSSSNGIERDATSSGASTNNKNVKRIDRAGTDQSRLLNRSGRNNCSQIIDLVPVWLESVTTGTTVIRSERRLKQDWSAGSGGYGGNGDLTQPCGCGHKGGDPGPREERCWWCRVAIESQWIYENKIINWLFKSLRKNNNK